LQIDTDLLRITTSTADELSRGTNIDDLERPWAPKISNKRKGTRLILYPVYTMKLARRAGSTSARRALVVRS